MLYKCTLGSKKCLGKCFCVTGITECIQLDGDEVFVAKTRGLRKKLVFANHFRNRGIGHLDDTLLRRAVQWSPQIFYAASKDNDAFKIIEAQRTIIESCINSFIDKNGVQKIFGTEIDLMYPPNAKEFFKYLSEIVNEAIHWLSKATAILYKSIDHHTDEEIRELAAIAGKTNFDLKGESDLNYSIEESKVSFYKAIKALEEQGVDPKILDFVRERFEI